MRIGPHGKRPVPLPLLPIPCSENSLPVLKAFRSAPGYRGRLWSAVPIPMYISEF